jgi:hypothetical protein
MSLAIAATARSFRRTSWQARLELSGGQVPGDSTFASTGVRLEFKSDYAERPLQHWQSTAATAYRSPPQPGRDHRCLLAVFPQRQGFNPARVLNVLSRSGSSSHERGVTVSAEGRGARYGPHLSPPRLHELLHRVLPPAKCPCPSSPTLCRLEFAPRSASVTSPLKWATRTSLRALPSRGHASYAVMPLEASASCAPPVSARTTPAVTVFRSAPLSEGPAGFVSRE